jgi:hypothetical protein
MNDKVMHTPFHTFGLAMSSSMMQTAAQHYKRITYIQTRTLSYRVQTI